MSTISLNKHLVILEVFMKTTWEQGHLPRVMRRNCKFDKFIVHPFFIIILLFQISVIFLADDPRKDSRTFPKVSPFTFVFSTISVNTRVLVFLFLRS